jgi:hypothetical protein
VPCRNLLNRDGTGIRCIQVHYSRIAPPLEPPEPDIQFRHKPVTMPERLHLRLEDFTVDTVRMVWFGSVTLSGNCGGAWSANLTANSLCATKHPSTASSAPRFPADDPEKARRQIF